MAKFKVGDEIEYRELGMYYICQVIQVHYHLNTYRLKMIDLGTYGSSFQGSLVYEWTALIPDSDVIYTLVTKPLVQSTMSKTLDVLNIKTIIEKKCTCDSRALFLKGCTCGAVQLYKLKMS